VIFLLSSCVGNKDYESFSVSPERLFSSDDANILVFDYSELNNRVSVDAFYTGFKDMKLWHELGFDLRFADFVDDINSVSGAYSYENLFLPILKSGFKVALNKEYLSLDFSKGFYVFSFNILEKDLATTLIDSFLTKKFGESLKKDVVSGVDIWMVEENSVFVARKGANFIFSNDFEKFEEVLLNLRDENLAKFSGNIRKDYAFLPVLQLYFGEDSVLSACLEKDGVRFFASTPERKIEENEIALIDRFSGSFIFFFLEDFSLKPYFSLFSDFDTSKFIGLSKEEFFDLIDSRFAFAMNYEEVFPEFSLMIDTGSMDFLPASRFLSFAEEFFADLGENLDELLLPAGFTLQEGLLKTGKVNDKIKKAYFDFSLLSEEKLSEFSSLFPGFSKDTKLEFQYGFDSGNVVVLSLVSDFSENSLKQKFSDSKVFKDVRQNIFMEDEEFVFYFNFLNFWCFWVNFAEGLWSWGLVPDSVADKNDYFRE
jgi:hypothetical protein